MSINFKTDIKPISYSKPDALALLRIIKISEDEINKGKFEDFEAVFSALQSKYFGK